MSVGKNLLDVLLDKLGGDAVLTDAETLSACRSDEFASGEIGVTPGVVVKPRTEEEVATVARLCNETGTPLTVRGGGTGLSGACVPSEGGVVLSMERMYTVREVDIENQTITAEAGVTLSGIYEAVDEAGLFFPPHPGDESAEIGGAVATNAGGSRAVKYGTIRDFVLGMRVVLADGTVTVFGGKVRKATCGYDFRNLLIGSEGTLGIITEVTLSLLRPPGAVYTLVVPFETTTEAINAVPKVLASGVVPMAVEFIDHDVVACSERLLKKTWPAKIGGASCIFILDGDSEDELLARSEKIAEIVEAENALDVLVASTATQQRDVLEIRSMVYEALRPGSAELLDVCVPRSEIAGHVELVAELAREKGVPLPTYGHAADGNVHTHLMRTRIDSGEMGEEIPDWRTLQSELRKTIYDDAVKRGGVISGEHGIGIVKRDYLSGFVAPEVIELMRNVKKVFDPRNILNPGKIFEL